jgi:hypothetical protein
MLVEFEKCAIPAKNNRYRVPRDKFALGSIGCAKMTTKV